MEILNYTGKDIGLTTKTGSPLKVLSSVGNARFENIQFEEVNKVDGAVISRKQFGKVLGLPKPDPNQQKLYIVPAEIAERIKNIRFDLLVAEEPFEWKGGTFYKRVVNC